MDEKEILKERFKSAVSSAVKVISENFDIEVKFGTSATSKTNSLNLPEIISTKRIINQLLKFDGVSTSLISIL